MTKFPLPQRPPPVVRQRQAAAAAAAAPVSASAARGSTWRRRPTTLLPLALLWASPLLLLLTGQVLAQQLPLFGGLNLFGLGRQAELEDPSAGLRLLHKQPTSSPQWLDIVRARGFIGELYTVLSPDNRPISIYHLINPRANQRTLNKYPALIFHGLGSDAAHMLSNSDLAKPRTPTIGAITEDPSDTALPFMLANNNFDVWMCDARGANLNNHPVSADFDPFEGQKYWNFSLDEQAHLDLPVILDFVLSATHEDKLHYVGFSESTTTMLALLSQRPDYQAKLASFTAMAPVAYVEHIRGIMMGPLAAVGLIPDTVNGNAVPQLAMDTLLPAVRELCHLQLFTRTLCPAAIDSFGGRSAGDSTGHSFWDAAIKSASIKTLKHYRQLYLQHRFGMYDYGPEGNVRQYGQTAPPAYPLANIKLPSIFLLRGGRDFLSTPEDQRRLIAELGAPPYLDLFYPAYNHLDFIISRNIVKEINLPTARVMLDWTREHARREARASILKDAAKALAPKPVAPVAVTAPVAGVANAAAIATSATATAATGPHNLAAGPALLGGGLSALGSTLTRAIAQPITHLAPQVVPMSLLSNVAHTMAGFGPVLG